LTIYEGERLEVRNLSTVPVVVSRIVFSGFLLQGAPETWIDSD
jgi:hypothetical protein